jgi:hypothetical protein
MSAVSDFFSSLKEDLFGKRLLPFLIVLGVLLVAAVAYAVLGGGSSSSPGRGGPVSASVPGGASASVGAVAVTHAPANPNQPISETTEGTSKQHHGVAHNPFTPLPAAKQASSTSAKPATTSSSSSSAGSSGKSSSGSKTSTSGAGGAAPTPAPTPTAPAKPKPPERIYHVLALFGLAPVAPAVSSTLTPYANIKRLTPLPSATAPLVVFMGVNAGGKSATFTLVGEAILHGNGTCLPSASQCQAIDLRPGQVEQLEYLPPNGQTIIYELTVVSISSSKASAAAAQRSYRVQSRAGRELLRHSGVPALTELHYSPSKGVLVFAGHRAFAARAHSARRHRR